MWVGSVSVSIAVEMFICAIVHTGNINNEQIINLFHQKSYTSPLSIATAML